MTPTGPPALLVIASLIYLAYLAGRWHELRQELHHDTALYRPLTPRSLPGPVRLVIPYQRPELFDVDRDGDDVA